MLPVLITLVWVIGLNLVCEKECWDDYPNHQIVYVLIVPMILALTANLLFLINIVRIIVTKLRNQPSLSNQQLQVRNQLSNQPREPAVRMDSIRMVGWMLCKSKKLDNQHFLYNKRQ